MPRSNDRLLRAYSVLLGWIGRLYGTFFLALGILFFYWAGRGLLAYATGIRAAWSDPLACVAGLVAGGLSVWTGLRFVRHGIPPRGFRRSHGMSKELEATLDEALRLEETDPAASRQLLDSYFMREAVVTDARRADLRQRAIHDLKSALDLRRELQDELASNAFGRREMLATLPEGQRTSVLTEIEAADHRLQSELLQLNATIERLKLK